MAEPPPTDAGVMLIARAFLELRTERQTIVYVRSDKNGNIGSQSVPGAIRWSAMLRWCRWHRLNRHVTAHVIEVIAMVDQRTRKVAVDRLKVR